MGKTKEMTFAAMLDNPVYKDRNALYALQPPGGFVHRTQQKNELVVELAPVLMNSPVTGVFVYGNPGTGKTGLVLDLIKELEQEAAKRHVRLRTAYVNCSENRTETAVLIELLHQLNPGQAYPRMGWNRTKALEVFQAALAKERAHTLIVLDEVDYVLKEEGDDVLYRLSRMQANISTVIISNDIRVSDYIKPRTQSAMGRIKIIFPPYTAEELYDVLKERARVAFKENTVSEAVLRKIADIEGQKHGDARRALELLDSCAKIALMQKRTKLSIDIVEEAEQTLEQDQLLNIIATLTKHQKLLYLAILKRQKDILMGMDVYKLYLETCESYNTKPLSERRIRSFVINLSELGLLESGVEWLSDLQKKTRKVTVALDTALKNKAIKLLRDSI